ncbi:MAG TPA: hypothetical protein VFA20_04885 [Myxococcaceae bacterium]|nr:hypothetical protein [Myxococcaceae bacterium]
MKTFSIKEVLVAGWKAFRENLSVFVTFGVAMLAIWFLEQVGLGIANSSGPMKPALSALVTLAARVGQIWLQVGLFRMALKLVDGQAVTTDDFLRAHGDFLGYLLASVLYGLIVGAGMILLVVPGIYWAVRYWAYGYAVVDEHVDPVTALKRSTVLTDGVKWEVFLFGLAVIGVNIVGAMALGVGLCATIPLTAVAGAKVYRILVARAAARMSALPPAPIGKPIEAH